MEKIKGINFNNDIKINKFFFNLNNYLVQIDYFDKNGVRKIKNKIPIKSMLNRKLL
jgi:hypothetical protein